MAFTRQILNNSPFSIAGYKQLMEATDGMPVRFELAHEAHNTRRGSGHGGTDRPFRFAQGLSGQRRAAMVVDMALLPRPSPARLAKARVRHCGASAKRACP